MKNIRQNVFETNSSSTHSISISENSIGILDTICPDDNGIITLRGGQFGWEWEKTNNSLTKANYCAVDCVSNTDLEQMLIDVIKDHTGAKDVVFGFDTDCYNFSAELSYIDHQSRGTSKEAFKDKETLKNFIFNSESVLYLGNDNENAPPNYFDPDNAEYKYLLEVEGSDVVAKFIEMPDEKQLRNQIDSIVERLPEHFLYPEKEITYDNIYDLISYENSDIDGKKFSSFDKLDQNIIVLYKLKHIHKADKYIGAEIISTIELSFTIKEIT